MPTQEPEVTTTLSRMNPFGLLVALNETSQATGDLYLDDGDTIDAYELSLFNYIWLEASARAVQSHVLHWNYHSSNMILENVTIIGLKSPVHRVTVNGIPYNNFDYNSDRKALFIRALNLALKEAFVINYE